MNNLERDMYTNYGNFNFYNLSTICMSPTRINERHSTRRVKMKRIALPVSSSQQSKLGYAPSSQCWM